MAAGSIVAAATLSLSSLMVPFAMPWDDASPTFTSLAPMIPKPAGRQGFVKVRDGHLATDQGRIRFVGMNFAFDAQTPTRPDADVIAARLAKFGINAVRLTMFDTPVPKGILTADQAKLDPQAMERFDYFVSRLKANGIYVFMSLHAIREYPGVAIGERMPQHHSGLDNFDRTMIDSQKALTRALLHHVNEFTGLRYVDDPVLASVEINNENALSMRWADGSIDRAPESYRNELKSLWNGWLARHHEGEAGLERAWNEAKGQADRMLIDPTAIEPATGKPWKLSANRGASASLEMSKGPGDAKAIEVSIDKLGQRDYDVSLQYPAMQMARGQSHTLEFDVRADAARRFGIALNQTSDQRLLNHEWLEAGPEWKRMSLVLTPGEGEGNVAFSFANLGTATGKIEFANVILRPGGATGVAAGEAAGAVALVDRSSYAKRTAGVQSDWMAFLADVEGSYFGEMYRFLRQDLGLVVPIVGTQQTYSQYPVQSKMDVSDVHVYWDTQKQVDASSFEMNNRPQVSDRMGGVLSTAAGYRMRGKPFIVSEYAYRGANTYATEADPMMFAFAAFQDWDGVFIFNYSNVANMRTDRFRGDEAFNGQWNRFVALVPAALLFQRGDVRPSRETAVVGVSPAKLQSKVRLLGPAPIAYQLGDVSQRIALQQAVAIEMGADRTPKPGPASPADRLMSDTNELAWDWREGGLFTVNTPKTQVLSGFVSDRPYKMGDMEIQFGTTRQGWVTATLSMMNPPARDAAGQWLLTLTGRAENEGMRFSQDGRRYTWGTGPLLIEAVPARVTFPSGMGRIEVWSLDATGRPAAQVAVRRGDDGQTFDVLPSNGSPWYKIEARP